MGKVNPAQSAQAVISSHLSSGEWVSRKALNLLAYPPKSLSRVLIKMQSEGYISCKGTLKNKHYRLLEKGRVYLRTLNPIRYTSGETDEKKRYEDENILRQALRNIVSTMATLSGYGTHPHDKPGLGTLDTSNENSRGFSPSSSVRPLLETIPPPTSNARNAIQNYTDFRYYPKPQTRSEARSRVGVWRESDTKIYRTRNTPVGCYYTRTELLACIRAESEGRWKNTGGIQGIYGSRVAGLLFTGSGAYKTYVTGDTAPKIRSQLEAAMTGYLKAWAGRVYQRSLEGIPAKLMSEQLRGSVLIGDESYKAAVSVIEQTNLGVFGKRDFKRGEEEKMQGGGKMYNYNLKDIPETFYLPSIREALPILSAMIYPGFEIALRNMYASYAELDGHRDFNGLNRPAMLFDALTHDGRDVACIIPLKLDRVMDVIQTANSETKGIVIYCPEYEVRFYDLLLSSLDEDIAALFEIRPIPQDFIEGYYAGELQDLFDYAGLYPTDEENCWTIIARKKKLRLGKKRGVE